MRTFRCTKYVYMIAPQFFDSDLLYKVFNEQLRDGFALKDYLHISRARMQKVVDYQED
jgi:hypothetical protein